MAVATDSDRNHKSAINDTLGGFPRDREYRLRSPRRGMTAGTQTSSSGCLLSL
ncbi:MAG: hypothetical protein OXD31_10425 [Chloroflexi bacterium]|nr:hypothetical protein [Chloroflexota bacterium]